MDLLISLFGARFVVGERLGPEPVELGAKGLQPGRVELVDAPRTD
jgi:hypothetical protein